jgi:hypothetical protein
LQKIVKKHTFWQNLMHKSFGRKFGKKQLQKIWQKHFREAKKFLANLIHKSFFEKLWQKNFSKIIGCTKVFRQKYYAEKGNRKVLEA